jgi:hypothetical protein
METIETAMSKATEEIRQRYLTAVKSAVNTATDATRRKYQLTYRCSVCNKPIELLPGQEDTKDAINYLQKEKWKHGECVPMR